MLAWVVGARAPSLRAVNGVSLQAALLREHFPDLTLRLGATVVARVVEQQGGKGMINLGGVLLAAQLPEGVRDGEKLRLQVQEVGQERVVLRLVDAAPVPVPVQLPLPDGGRARLRVDDDEPAAAERGQGEFIALVYDSARLGPMHLRLELTPGAIRARVQARAGEPYELAGEAAEQLRQALAGATGREAIVTVEPRREPLDVYA
jgi:hypothetical protein